MQESTFLLQLLLELSAPDISTASSVDSILDKCSKGIHMLQIKGPQLDLGSSDLAETLLHLIYMRGSLAVAFDHLGTRGKDRAVYLSAALKDLHAAAQLDAKELTAVKGGRQKGLNSKKAGGPIMSTPPEFHAMCTELIAIIDCAEVESEVEAKSKAGKTARAKELYDSARALMERSQHAQAAKAAQESVDLLPDWTEGYAMLGQALEGSGDFKAACNVYVNALKRDSVKHSSLIPALQAANNIANLFSDEFMEHILYDKKCGACGAFDVPLNQCTRCKSACYCCREHQRQRWPEHKLVCKALEEHLQDKADILEGWPVKDVQPKVPVTRMTELSSWGDVDRHFPFSPSVPRGIARYLRSQVIAPLR
eukprot:gene1771-33187_t